MTIDKFVIKVASRCNINCSYCYMYNMGDLSYKKQPKFINEETVKAFVEKLEVHVKKHEIKLIGIIIHGGEPLLMNKNELINFVTSFNSLNENKTEVKFYLQTNAILIDDEWCDLFKKYKIDVGVSLDGSKIENDKFRIDKKGNGTYDDVINGINILKKNNLKTGILSVMNLNSNPIDNL